MKDILTKINKRNPLPEFFSVTGNHGTGKSLVIYGIIKELNKEFNICVVHCGILNNGHWYLKERGLNIIAAKDIHSNWVGGNN